MQKREFEKLLRKYNKGQSTPEEESFIDEWFKAMGAAEEKPTGKAQRNLVKDRSWLLVRRYILQSKVHRATAFKGTRSSYGYSGSTWAIAASVLLVIGSMAYVLLAPNSAEFQKAGVRLTEKNVRNDTEKVMQVLLEDGTEVLLQPKSSITYKERFGALQRMVTLDGEAFFNVSKDSLRPFLVNTNDIVTKVLGTSFNVSAFLNDESVTVEVKTGKVSVMTKRAPDSAGQSEREVILTPNQKVVYNKVKNEVYRGIIDEPQPILSTQVAERMYFEEAPVNEIFAALAEVYGVDIVFDEDVLASCILSTSIGEGSIYSRLDVICKAIGATYIFEGDHIVIDGAGCN